MRWVYTAKIYCVMVEALDKMVTESLSEEIEEFHSEKQAMNEDRVKAQMKLRESATKFNDFMVTKLAEEIKELRSDRIIAKESQQKLEQFIVHALAREIKEFAQDKQAVVEAKVKIKEYYGHYTWEYFIHEKDEIRAFIKANALNEDTFNYDQYMTSLETPKIITQ